jgi:hypothetical protein
MKNWRTPAIILTTIAVFWFIKFQLNFPSADIEIIGVILTIASILFGFLGGFFISELWSRYTEIRQLQTARASELLNIITYAKYFFKNKTFEKEFKHLMEKSSIVDELIRWNEGFFEIQYFRNIEESFKHIIIKDKKSEVYFNNLLDSYNSVVEHTVRLDTLGQDKLFPSEWLMLIGLSLTISLSILFLDISHFFYRIIIVTFPAIIALALSIIHDLDTMLWSIEAISLEPNEIVFDAIGVKRFYKKKNAKHISKKIEYRTEDELTGEYKEIYNKLLDLRKKK